MSVWLFLLCLPVTLFFPDCWNSKANFELKCCIGNKTFQFWLVTHGEWTNQLEILCLFWGLWSPQDGFHEVLIPIHTITLLSKSRLPAPNTFFFFYTPHFASPVAVPHLYDAQALLSGEKPLNRKQVVGQLCAQPPTYTVGEGWIEGVAVVLVFKFLA